MALKGQITVNETLILEVDADPTVEGVEAPLSTIALLDSSPSYGIWLKIGPNNTDWSALAFQSELDATQTGAGLNTNGTYSPNQLTNYIESAESLKDADNILDNQIKIEETDRIAEDLTFLKLDGTRPMTGNLDLDNKNIFNINKNENKIAVTVPSYMTATQNGSAVLTNESNTTQFITGMASGFSIILPDATTLELGTNFDIYNRSSSPIIVKYFNGDVLGSVSTESVASLILQDNTTQNGIFSPFTVEIAQAAGILNYAASSTTPFATTSTTYTPITDFVVIPNLGKYAIWFNASATSTTNNAITSVALYKGNTIVAESERVAQSVASNFTFQINTLAVVDFDGTQELRVYVKVTTGTLTVNARTGVATRLGPIG